MTNSVLPAPVSAYVEATNSFNLDGLVAIFDDDALVNDHRVEFIGKEQIRAWAAREIIGDHVTMKVIDQRLVGSHVALSGAKISAVIIVNNKIAN